MTTRFFFFNALIFVFSIKLTAQSYDANSIILKAKSEISQTEIIELVSKKLSKVKTTTSRPISLKVEAIFSQKLTIGNFSLLANEYYILRFEDSIQTESAFELLKNRTDFSNVQRNYIYKLDSTPNDSAYSSQWNLRRIGISSLYENGTINKSLPEIIVGVIDTGIDDVHPDLINNIVMNSGEFGNGKESNGIDDDNNGFVDDWRGYDFVDLPSKDGKDWNVRDNDPFDENGHGTGVSGIIGAQSNNFKGITGFGTIKILPVRAFSANGTGYDVDIAAAIYYAANNGAEVINMSFGDVVQSLLLKDVIQYAYKKGVSLVTSSGNDGSNKPHYPSDLSDVISVGSVGIYDARSFFSSYSPSLDIMAPGEMIPTTVVGGYSNNFSGTSAAAPHVSGSIALLKSIEKTMNTSNQKFSNEDWRAILLNSADDIDAKGWDEKTGAGILNVSKAIQSLKSGVVKIISPAVDEVVSQNIKIQVTAISPYFESASLWIGQGDSPLQWNLLTSFGNNVDNDSIYTLILNQYNDGSYVLRLTIKNSKGNDIETRNRITIHAAAPKIIFFQLQDSIIVNNEYGALVEVDSDVPTTGKFFYRKAGSSNLFSMLRSSMVGRSHQFIITSRDLEPNIKYQFYCEFTENSPTQRSTIFPTIRMSDSLQLMIFFPSEKIPSTTFSLKPYSLPSGFLLNSFILMNEKKSIFLNEYNSDGEFGKLKFFQFENGIFTQKDSFSRSWIPRSFVQNENKHPIILVQDYGISRVYAVDSITAKIVQTPLWGDSTDVWGSQLVDLDGDLKPEIIARSSSEILIYKNLNNNSFQLQTRLQNNSKPLDGEAKNQFGPPKVIVGYFTKFGKENKEKEIIFADYDGDIIMYRQKLPNSLSFEPVWIDSSNLFEMSDYLVAGDFDGDGITDFAVAGHSNLDQNYVREYDAPYWVVRIFSTDGRGSLSRVWQQSFYGIKAGTKFDNGLSSGKILLNSTNDALILNLNPKLYVIQYNAGLKKFIPIWEANSQSNNIIAGDFDGNGIVEFGFNDSQFTKFWEKNNFTNKPQTPWALSAKPLSSSRIAVNWNSTNNFGIHNIYRGTSENNLTKISSVTGTQWIDSTVSQNVPYWYAVTYSNILESDRTNPIKSIPHNPATIVDVVQSSLSQLTIEFSFPISQYIISSAVVLVDEILNSTSAVQISDKKILFTFQQPMLATTHTLKIKNLADASGMFADTVQIFSFTTFLKEEELFFAKNCILISPTSIKLEFNEPLQKQSAISFSHYLISNIARSFTIESIEFDSTKPMFVIIHTNSTTSLSSIALRIEINLNSNILSTNGKKINNGKGQTLSIAQEIDNLDNIVVFPNPMKFNNGVIGKISFVNLPKNCRITIYSISGGKIKTFDQLTSPEGVAWNMRNENGNIIPSGIYLFRVEQLNDGGEVLKTKLGKFAMVR